MNSVAIPASAPVGALGAEGELVRQAARGDAEALAELFRRHGQMAWRLAQAVAANRDGAVASVATGFVRALQAGPRRQKDREAGFRPTVLAAVYRHAIDDARARAANPAPPASAPAEGDAVMTAAFRSLPERWRAALWLTEVESIAPERMAAILGVSPAAASQLLVRGRRGLAGRLTQVHAAVPEHLAPALRAVAIPMPANLAEIVAGAWGSLATGAGARLAPINLWLTEHAVRPLQVTVVGLIGLGVIGLGLVGEGTTVNTPQVAAPVIPVGKQPATSLGGGVGTGGAGGVNNPGPVLNISPGAGTTAAATTGTGAAATGAGTPAATSTLANPATATTAPHTAVTSGPAAGTTIPSTPGSIVTPPTTPITQPKTTATTAPATKTVVNLGPVANVTQTNGATTVNVLPSTSPTTAPAPVSVTLGCSTGLGVTVGTVTVGCPAPTASTPTTTTPSSGGLLGAILPGL